VMGTDSPDPQQQLSRGKQQQIAEMLEEIAARPPAGCGTVEASAGQDLLEALRLRQKSWW